MFARTSSVSFQRKALFQMLAMCVVLPVCALAARPFLETLDWGQVNHAWNDITPVHWLTAIFATAISFAALGRYDVIVHRVLNTGVNANAAQASGAAAVALSQTLGFGLIIGSLARWRGLNSLSILSASKVTALVSISFLGAWLTLFAVSGLIFPNDLPLKPIVFYASLFSAVCFILYTLVKRYISIAGHRTRLPSLRAILSLMCCAALDTGFAAMAFWAVLPESAGIGFATLFPIYLICLGSSLISNTPGGVGPFEVSLLWALPQANINELLAGLIAFRLVYFALPACVAAIYLFRPVKDQVQKSRTALFARGLHPETGSGLQTGATLIGENGQIIGATARTTQTTSLLFEPAMALRPSLDALGYQAHISATTLLIYKCHARTALRLRKQGFAVVRIAQDGLIDLENLSISSSKCRGLRRKLRSAEKTGVVVRPFDLTCDSFEMLNEIDLDWHDLNGTARGISMGRMCREYLTAQDIFTAWQGDRLIAFISCHKAAETWTLDIMRNRKDIPSGTMHALIWHAINSAKKAGCHTFSLASTTYDEAPILKAVEKFSFFSPPHTKGLSQFKRAFAPRWQPLYAAAPSHAALCLALWDVWQEIHDPPPLTSNARALDNDASP